MLALARNRQSPPGVTFAAGDIAQWSGHRVDVVLANASLHWVPDHGPLLGRLRAAAAPGGQLAFQVPFNFDHPSHRLAVAVAGEEPFAQLLGSATPPDVGRNVLSPRAYAERLHALGAVAPRVRVQVYGHLLPSTADVVDWISRTLLTPYRGALGPSAFEAFVARYRSRILAELGDQRPYFYAFPRILAWARFA
jgi:trans-aconitate 2-methyltransferase